MFIFKTELWILLCALGRCQATTSERHTMVGTLQPREHSNWSAAKPNVSGFWKKSWSNADQTELKISLAKYHAAIKQAKQDYYSARITSNIGNPKKLWNTLNNIFHRHGPFPLPSPSSPGVSLVLSLPAAFANYFTDKIVKLRAAISSKLIGPCQHLPVCFISDLSPKRKSRERSSPLPTSTVNLIQFLHHF